MDFELAMYMTNAFPIPCLYDAECKLPGEIYELVEGDKKCKGNVDNNFRPIERWFLSGRGRGANALSQ